MQKRISLCKKKVSEFVFPDNIFVRLFLFSDIVHFAIYFARQNAHIGKSCESSDILEKKSNAEFVCQKCSKK